MRSPMGFQYFFPGNSAFDNIFVLGSSYNIAAIKNLIWQTKVENFFKQVIIL